MSDLINKAREYRAFVELAVQDRPDGEAIKFVCLHPHWRPGITAQAGYRYQYEGKLYRCLTTHITQEGWEPGINTASLFTEVNEVNAGSQDDPIPYDKNMALEAGKYYSQNGVIYLCNRDTVNPVYADLADLVGLYVEVID